MNQLAIFTRPIKRIYKLIASYLKPDWSLSDYPIEYRQQKILDLSDTNLTMYPWEARIVNWYWMNGDGHTKKEAYKKLKEKFERYKSEDRKIPRPGSKENIKFASVERMDDLDAGAALFFREVFDIDYYGMFISDESSVYDFCWTDDVLNEKQKKIQEVYGININDTEGLKIVDILEQIKKGTGIT